MARKYNQITLKILKQIISNPGISAKHLYLELSKSIDYKAFYNTLFRLTTEELIKKVTGQGQLCLEITEEGEKLFRHHNPQKGNTWKIVIFDIPESHKQVRSILRAKLKALHFKKWQNSIWVSPFKLDPEIEKEFNELSKKFYIRLIKTKEINNTEDLEKMFGNTK